MLPRATGAATVWRAACMVERSDAILTLINLSTRERLAPPGSISPESQGWDRLRSAGSVFRG